MKMKGLLLGSAAGIVALTGVAQAADLPVKARAVEYVRICSIYGEGFYYLPGTETCLKVGGYVRAEWGFNAGGSHGPNVSGQRGRDNREDTPNYFARVRGIVSWDARSQTEYGTLRAYIRFGHEFNSGDASYVGVIYSDRAFIQLGGWTFGKQQSFFDFYANALNMSTLLGGGSMNSTGVNLLSYTFNFGGGFSATLSAEDTTHHRAGIFDANTIATNPVGAGTGLTLSAVGGLPAPNFGNYRAAAYPDVIGNLRVDQPWGSAQISAALHDASGSYNGPGLLGARAANREGFAVQGGVKFNLPWAQGDSLWLQAAYANGAVHYLGYNPYVHFGGQFAMFRGGPPAGGCPAGTVCGNLGAAWAYDAIFDATTGTHLTSGCAFLAAVQHYWTPAVRSTVFGHYTSVNYNAGGTAAFCRGGTVAGAGTTGNISTAALAVCNPDFRVFQIGSNTYWSPVRNLDIGVEVLYTRLDQSHVGNWTTTAVQGARPAGLYTARDTDIFSGNLRFQRNFWP